MIRAEIRMCLLLTFNYYFSVEVICVTVTLVLNKILLCIFLFYFLVLNMLILKRCISINQHRLFHYSPIPLPSLLGPTLRDHCISRPPLSTGWRNPARREKFTCCTRAVPQTQFFILSSHGRSKYPSSSVVPACDSETWVPSLGREDPLEMEVATHSNIPAWKIPCIEEPGGQHSMGLQQRTRT